nr:uncharacterized protein LOC113805569 [Penaeus vannamei]
MSSRKMDKMFLFVLCLLWHVDRGTPMAINEVTVLEGHSADLPCVTTPRDYPPRTPDDPDARPKLILWYKENIKETIYSYDGRTPGNERHWAPRRALGGALNLTLPATPLARPQLAFLTIAHVHETDAGLYRCRVDFRRGRSVNTTPPAKVIGGCWRVLRSSASVWVLWTNGCADAVQDTDTARKQLLKRHSFSPDLNER